MLILLLQLILPSNTWTITYPPSYYEIPAYVTAYTATGELNAAGTMPKFTEVACPRDIKLNTIVSFMGYEWVCRDRYALWVDEVRDLPTFDIYAGTDEEGALMFGKQKVMVKIKL